ncbi:MAG: NADH-quinone oxidoreductase subunit C [Verrucomicrobiota bacterium]|jgi:NADH-quinone oxidoreductase subunit C
MSPLELAQKLKGRFGVLISEPAEFRGEITVALTDADVIAEVCAFAKADLGFDYLVDITSVDNYGAEPRWTLVYHLYGYGHHCALRLKTHVSEELSEIGTVTGVWRAADWHEREIYDMMGIRFRGHPDLRRILMWEGYPHFPLRKDFPLAGKPTDAPNIAFTRGAPEEGGPFVTVAGGKDTLAREPRARVPESPPADLTTRAEAKKAPKLPKIPGVEPKKFL